MLDRATQTHSRQHCCCWLSLVVIAVNELRRADVVQLLGFFAAAATASKFAYLCASRITLSADFAAFDLWFCFEAWPSTTSPYSYQPDGGQISLANSLSCRIALLLQKAHSGTSASSSQFIAPPYTLRHDRYHLHHTLAQNGGTAKYHVHSGCPW